MNRWRNILIAIALVGFSVPTPIVALGACATEMRAVPAKGCCGKACTCADTGGCECRSRPRTPAPQPPQHQAADPVSEFQQSATTLQAAAHPVAQLLPSSLPHTPRPAVEGGPEGIPLAGRHLALLGTLLI
jgi:hypothetical protein